MARNRKSQSVAVRFGPALKAFLLCLLIGGSGVGYVWQKEQIARLGRLIANKESTLKALQDQNEILSRQLAGMYSPKTLALRIKEGNLGLVPPQESQIVRLSEPVARAPRSSPETRFAARSERRDFAP